MRFLYFFTVFWVAFSTLDGRVFLIRLSTGEVIDNFFEHKVSSLRVFFLFYCFVILLLCFSFFLRFFTASWALFNVTSSSKALLLFFNVYFFLLYLLCRFIFCRLSLPFSLILSISSPLLPSLSLSLLPSLSLSSIFQCEVTALDFDGINLVAGAIGEPLTSF